MWFEMGQRAQQTRFAHYGSWSKAAHNYTGGSTSM